MRQVEHLFSLRLLESRVLPSISFESGLVRFSNTASTQPLETRPFPGFTGVIESASGDVNNDSYDDLIVAAGPGGGPHVKVFSGKDGLLLQNFFAYEPEFTGGVYVGCADVNGDGRADIVTGAGPGGGPRVRVFSGATGVILRDFIAYDPNFRGGATVTSTDCDLDGMAEVITGAGPGGGPHVKVFSGKTGAEQTGFFAFDQSFQGGTFVSCAEVTNDGHPDILVTPGIGGGPVIHRYDGLTRSMIDASLNGNPDERNGTRISSEPIPNRNAVQDWNRGALQAIKDVGVPPPKASRLLAMMHVAQFDAVNAIVGGYQPYQSDLPVPPVVASAEAAASASAYQILRDQLPTYRDRLDQLWNGYQAKHQSDPGFVEGKSFGEQVAAKLLSKRQSDGSSATVAYTPGGNPGDWSPTLPANAAALLPGWGRVTPFAMMRGDQFRPTAPPELPSDDYSTDYNEVRQLGAKASSVRTADQTLVAKFWADGAGTVTPPGHWNVIAQGLALQRNMNLLETSRLFAALNTALADAGISSWDVKYAENLWRPITAIRQGDTDGNSATSPDANWEPLLTTPPFPSYTSGHSTFSGAAAEVLETFFGETTFQTQTDSTPDVIRQFASFKAAAEEAGKSRIYGGIHFEFDNRVGLTAGEQIGDWVMDNYFKPIQVS